MIFVAITLGMNERAVLISQLFSAKKMETLKTVVVTAIISVLVLRVILTILECLGCDMMIRLLQTPDIPEQLS